MRNIFINNKGIAILEAAGLLSLLTVFMFSGFAVVEYTRAASTLQSIVDKHLYDDAKRPFKFTENLQIAVDNEGLTRLTDKTNSQITKAVQDYLMQEFNDTSVPFLVETAYAQLSIDEESGNGIGNENFSPTYSKTFGDGELSTTFFNKAFVKYALLQGNDADGNLISEYSVPNAEFFLKNSNKKFIPFAVLVGSSISVSYQDTFLGKMLSLIGANTLLRQLKIVRLRGEIESES